MKTQLTKKFILGLILSLLINLTCTKLLTLDNESLPELDLNSESKDANCKIPNCLACHKGFMGEACDQCADGYGVDKKAIGDDLCVECHSAVAHCKECSDLKIWWNCTACDAGFRVIQMPTADDLCVPVSQAK